MMTLWKYVHIKSITCIIALSVVIILWKTFAYLIIEFVLHLHSQTPHACIDEVSTHVPEYIHQIFYPIRSPTASKRNQNKMQTWKDFHPSFTYRLWNETAVTELIKTEYPKLLPLYHSYPYWVQRVDVAKYVILHHYGGWYIDLDISCINSLKNLAKEMTKRNRSVVLHKERTLGPATDLIGISPRHPFIKFALDGLPRSNKWFLLQHTTIMLSTGPTFLFGRYLNYPCSDEILVLSLKDLAQYVWLSHDGSWYGNDSRFIYYALDHKLFILTLVLIIIIVTGIFFFIFVK